MRCFIAVDIPEFIRKEMHSLQKSFGKVTDLRLVEPAQLHCTLHFLGDIEKEGIEKAKSVLEKVALRHNAVKCRLEGLGVFPSADFVRVIVVRMKDTETLVGIQKDIVSGLGVSASSGRGFVPHITIARVRSSKNMDSVRAELEKNSDFKTSCFVIDEIKLKKSDLSHGGPVYNDVSVYRLHEHA